MSPDDAFIEKLRPRANALSVAVDAMDQDAVARLLRPLDVRQLQALAILLAAHCDVPLTEAKKRRPSADYDFAVVERILSGDWPLARFATAAERVTVISLWQGRGGSQADLEELTGWNVSRILRDHDQQPQGAAA